MIVSEFRMPPWRIYQYADEMRRWSRNTNAGFLLHTETQENMGKGCRINNCCGLLGKYKRYKHMLTYKHD